jgi:cytochrome c oxidase subunit 2
VGVKSHASNYIEGAVAIVEGVLLILVAVPLWAKAVGSFPPEEKSTVIQIVAQQFNWNARYAGKDGKFGKQDMKLVSSANVFGVDPNDAAGKDDISVNNDIHVVVNKPVICYISSKDVIHSFKIIAMRVTQDAIPGMRIPIWFTPTEVGTYQINCAQLCGNSHSAMTGGSLVVQTQEEFDKWIASKTPGGGGSLE